MNTENIIQIAESTINNVVRVTRIENNTKIVTFSKVGDRHDKPVKIDGLIKR